MSLRKILLRLMLVSLAVAAGVGILAVLVVGERAVGRIAGTGFLLAIAFGLMLALSLLIDKPITRWAGMVGVTSSGISGILILDLIWGDLFFARNWQVNENMVVSAWAVFAYGAIAACSVVGIGVDKKWWRWIGVAASAVAFLVALVAAWGHLDTLGVQIAAATGIAIIVAHANVVFLCNLHRGQQWVRWGTVVALVVASILVDIFFTQPSYTRGPDDLISRGIAATSIAAGCGTLAILVLARLNRKNAKPILPAGVKELAIVCPWCSQKQTLPLGASRCGGCGLKFQIAVEEPHCPNCDYLLYMLSSDRCPECGTIITRTQLDGNTGSEVIAPAGTIADA